MLRNQRPAAVLAALSLALAAALGAAPAAVAAPLAAGGILAAGAPAAVPAAAAVPYSAATVPPAVPAETKAAPRHPARADVLVNRSHPLVPRTYVPRLVTVKGVAGVPVKLRPGAAAAYAKVAAGARKGGVVLRATSSYRSYWTQATLMANYTRWYGAAYAKRVVAPAGTKTTTANLNLRAGPGTGHRILATVPKGKKVVTTGKRSGSWHQVKYGARTGWMSGTYLR